MRDDFKIKTKDILAKRVGFKCSNPECEMSTIGPNSDINKVINIGVAAHITAASPGGPRYDENISNEARQNIENGIWLCQSCSVLIDRDEKGYSVDLLKDWKKQAEDRAADNLNKQLNNNLFYIDDGDLKAIKSNGLYTKTIDGQNFKYYLLDGLLHFEHEISENVIAYYIFDNKGNVLDQKFPYPIKDYEIVIDPLLILRQSKENIADNMIREVFTLKWGKKVIVDRKEDGELVSFDIKNGAIINHQLKRITIKQFEI
jgi:hypothetical protein